MEAGRQPIRLSTTMELWQMAKAKRRPLPAAAPLDSDQFFRYFILFAPRPSLRPDGH